MSEEREGVIVIGGGVGPMAGVALHAKIIEATVAEQGDRSHVNVIHISRSSAIADRTAFLLQSEGQTEIENPGLAMARVFGGAARSLEEGEWAVGGVPCNTFHAPEIFDAFLSELGSTGDSVRVIHMLDETVALLKERLDGKVGVDIGVMSTTGTRISGVYDRLLEAAGYRAVYVEEIEQPHLHDSIYNNEWGIKAVSPVTPRAANTVSDLAMTLVGRGVAAILPACTELPLALPGDTFQNIPLVDPVLALARALVREAAPNKLAKL